MSTTETTDRIAGSYTEVVTRGEPREHKVLLPDGTEAGRLYVYGPEDDDVPGIHTYGTGIRDAEGGLVHGEEFQSRKRAREHVARSFIENTEEEQMSTESTDTIPERITAAVLTEEHGSEPYWQSAGPFDTRTKARGYLQRLMHQSPQLFTRGRIHTPEGTITVEPREE